MKTEEGLKSLKSTSNVPIKEEEERLSQDSHAPELVEQEFMVDLEYLHSFKTEEDPSDAVAHTVQQITTDAQASNDGNEYTIRLLTSEDEFLHYKKDSGSLSQETNHQVLPTAEEQLARASISDEKNENCELQSNINPTESQTLFELKYKCELCSRFISKNQMKEHLMTHTKNRERKFPCQLCENAFYTRPQLMKHMRTHANECFNCEFCGEIFLQQRSLTKHMSRLHTYQLDQSASYSPGTQESAIDLVEVTQNEAYELSPNIHPKKSSRNCERLYKCKLCPRFFKNEKYLTYHKKTHRQNRKRKFDCAQCEKAFYTKKNLDRHVRTHSGVTYDCHLCGAGFTQTTNLKAHMLRQHLGETQQLLSSLDPQTPSNASVNTKAELCSDEEFLDDDAAPGSQESSLQPTAEQNKSSLSEDKMESCEVCHKLFPKELISTHMRLDHSERLFKCEFCPCSFKTAFNFKRHRLMHANDRTREFGCDSCGKAFFTKQNLSTHMEVHSAARVSCELCGSTFSRKGNLKAHLLKLHPRETKHIL